MKDRLPFISIISRLRLFHIHCCILIGYRVIRTLSHRKISKISEKINRKYHKRHTMKKISELILNWFKYFGWSYASWIRISQYWLNHHKYEIIHDSWIGVAPHFFAMEKKVLKKCDLLIINEKGPRMGLKKMRQFGSKI